MLAGPSSSRECSPPPRRRSRSVGSVLTRPALSGASRSAAGTPYTGDFPDPTVLRVGTTYYAASTTVAALNLPMMTSTRPAPLDAAAGVRPGQAARTTRCRPVPPGRRRRTTPRGKVFWPTWAPSVMRLGAGPLRRGVRRARARAPAGAASRASRSATPLGPFVDRTRGPLACWRHGGDRPAVLPRPRRVLWLLYKVGRIAGPAVGAPDDRASGTAFGADSRNYALLAPRTAWEGARSRTRR